MSRKSSKPELISVSHRCTAFARAGEFVIVYKSEDGTTIDFRAANEQAAIHKFNSFCFGFKDIRITRNLMNREAGPIVIDADTPIGCDVGSETYWSM